MAGLGNRIVGIGDGVSIVESEAVGIGNRVTGIGVGSALNRCSSA